MPLAGLSRQALHVLAVAFSVERIKCQGGLTRGYDADNDQLIAHGIFLDVAGCARERL